MNILISNDDGIGAQGIKALVKALSDVATVYVCAPHTQRSAASHSITMRTPIRIEKSQCEGAAFAMTTTGTPADCVKLGIKILEDNGIDIDMVFSGINMGSNLGTDTIYSGTVGAAMQGNICGKPAVAVSVDGHEASHFDYACELAVSCVEHAYGKLDEKHILNINVPDVPKEEVKGVRYTVLGPRGYVPDFELVSGVEGDLENLNLEYMYAGAPVSLGDISEDKDVKAMDNGYASISILGYDFTDYALSKEIEGWGITK